MGVLDHGYKFRFTERAISSPISEESAIAIIELLVHHCAGKYPVAAGRLRSPLRRLKNAVQTGIDGGSTADCGASDHFVGGEGDRSIPSTTLKGDIYGAD